MMQILVLENNPKLNRSICDYLNGSGFLAVGYAYPEAAFQEMCGKRYELIIADVDVLEKGICETVHKLSHDAPILFVSETRDLANYNIAFRLGIDEYMDKPIVWEELMMRVHAILRHSNVETEQKIHVGNLELDSVLESAFVNGKQILLSTIEFHVLYKLLSYPGKTLSRAQLAVEIWGVGSDVNLRLVDIYVCKLRRKFSHGHVFKIVTIRSRGYMAVLTAGDQNRKRKQELTDPYAM